jgi:glycosyltransferase involved in cell wall biosynthesis
MKASAPISVVAIITAYNEEDIIEEVVRTLIDDGIKVYFIDNHSTDKTVAQVERHVGRGVIGIERFPAENVEEGTPRTFLWEQLLRRKEQLAQELDADWFIHSDADEFRESPWAGETQRAGISRVDAAGYNAIDFQVLNFIPTTADDGDGKNVRDRMQHYEPGQVFDRLQIKCWKKTSQKIELAASGGHSAQFAGRRVFPIRFLLRHYPIRSQAHGERKVFQERLCHFRDEERARGWHVQYDRFAEGVSFVQDPASLTQYDPEVVRLDLMLNHREVERLERVVAASQDEADRLVDVLSRRNEEIRQRDEEIGRRDGEIGRRDEEIAALRADVTARDTTISQLTTSRSWKLTAPLRAVDRLLRGPNDVEGSES